MGKNKADKKKRSHIAGVQKTFLVREGQKNTHGNPLAVTYNTLTPQCPCETRYSRGAVPVCDKFCLKF